MLAGRSIFYFLFSICHFSFVIFHISICDLLLPEIK